MEEQLIKKFEDVIKVLNSNWQQDPDMLDTPKRLAKMYSHFFRNEDPAEHFKKIFPTSNKNSITIKNIECFGMCPHHLLPIIYKVSIGYIPNGYALGLSKFSRISRALASTPKLQENFCCDIVNAFKKHLSPKGVICTVEGMHGCMRCRGVEEKTASVVTYDAWGSYKTNPDLRSEFMSFITL